MVFNFFTRWGEAVTPPAIYDANYRAAVDGTDQLVLKSNGSLDKGTRVVWRDPDTDEYHEHVVSSIREVHDKTGRVTCELVCINSVSELYAVDHTGQIGSGGVSGYNDTVTIDAEDFFDLVLLDTRWEYGGAGDYGTDISTVTVGKTTDNSVRELIASAMATVPPLYDRPAELRAVPTVDPTTGAVTARTLYAFYPPAPEDVTTIRRYTYSKNLLGASREVHDTEVYTACRAIGAEIETDGIVTGRHEASIWDDDFLAVYGIPDAAGNMTHSWMRIFVAECEDDTALQTMAAVALATQLHPDVEYTVSLAEMRDVKLGDYVDVIDTSFSPELRIRVRVTEIQKNLLSGAVSGNVNTSAGSGSGSSGTSGTSGSSGGSSTATATNTGNTSGTVRMGSTSVPASITAYQKATDNVVTAAQTTVSTDSNVTIPAKINDLQQQINKLKASSGGGEIEFPLTTDEFSVQDTNTPATKYLSATKNKVRIITGRTSTAVLQPASFELVGPNSGKAYFSIAPATNNAYTANGESGFELRCSYYNTNSRTWYNDVSILKVESNGIVTVKSANSGATLTLNPLMSYLTVGSHTLSFDSSGVLKVDNRTI